MVCSGFRYSCLLFRMCNAYTEIRLFVFVYILYVHGVLFLLISQSGQHMICYMFCIIIYIVHYSYIRFVVSYRIIGCI